jgi:hypothetical protein
MARKAGVSSPEELKAFVTSAGSKLLVGKLHVNYVFL